MYDPAISVWRRVGVKIEGWLVMRAAWCLPLLAAALMFCGGESAAAATGWQVFPPTKVDGNTPTVEQMTAVAPNDAYAIGVTYGVEPPIDQLVLQRWNGTQWHGVRLPMPAGTDQSAGYSVAGSSGANVWAGGYAWATSTPTVEVPVLEHWNGQQWQLRGVPEAAVARRVTSVGTGGPDDVTIITEAPDCIDGLTSAWHYNGRGWTRENTTNPCNPRLGVVGGLWEPPGGDVWQAGQLGSPLSRPEVGCIGTNCPATPFGCAQRKWGLTEAVTGTSASDVWAVGIDATANKNGLPVGTQAALVCHWNGRRWSNLSPPSPAFAVDLSSATESPSGVVWAAGRRWPRRVSRLLLERYTPGFGWAVMHVPDPDVKSDSEDGLTWISYMPGSKHGLMAADGDGFLYHP